MAARVVIRAAWRLAAGQARSRIPGAASDVVPRSTRGLLEGGKRGFAAGGWSFAQRKPDGT